MAGGRPTKITPEVIQKLEYAFSIGCTDLEACLHAGISKSALYTFQDANEQFKERKDLLKKRLILKSRIVVDKELDDSNIDTAKWYLERKCKKEFSTKIESELSGPNGDPLTIAIKDCMNRTAGLPSEDK